MSVFQLFVGVIFHLEHQKAVFTSGLMLCYYTMEVISSSIAVRTAVMDNTVSLKFWVSLTIKNNTY